MKKAKSPKADGSGDTAKTDDRPPLVASDAALSSSDSAAALGVTGSKAAAPSSSPVESVPIGFPPASASIPKVPSGFVKPGGRRYAGTLPNKLEMSRLSLAATELAAFTNYAETFGTTVPPFADMLSLLQVTSAWTGMRIETAAWAGYSLEQEGLAWTLLRASMAKLSSALELALGNDPGLELQMPNLVALLGAKSAVAKKASATKAANKAAVAAGEPPTHGRVGKQRRRAAEKQAYLSSMAEQATAPAAAEASNEERAKAPAIDVAKPRG